MLFCNLHPCQTIDKVRRFCLPIKSANKNLSSVMQKSADFVGRSSNIEHILFSTTKSANFLDIGHTHRFLCVHGDCLQWEMNIYFRCLFCLLLYDVYFHSLDAEKIMQGSFCDLHSSWYHTKLQTIKFVVCHGSAILSANFLRRLNHVHKSWPTLLIVWHLLQL